MASNIGIYAQMGTQSAAAEGAGATAGMVAGIQGTTNILKDRWWKKEFEEFKESAGAEFRESVSRVGDLYADETSEDVEGAWKIYQSASMKLMERVAEYKDNPYIGQLGQQMLGHTQNLMGDLTKNKQLEAQATASGAAAAASRASTEATETLTEPRKGLIEAQTAELKSRTGKGTLSLPTKTIFGDAKQFRNTPEPLWMDMVQGSKGYKDLVSSEVLNKSARAWENLPDEDKANFVMSETEEEGKAAFAETYTLSDAEQRELRYKSAAMLVGQLYGPTRTPFEQGALVDSLVGRKYKEIADAVQAVPKIGKNQQLQSGSPAMNTLVFGRNEGWAEAGFDPIEEPYTPDELKARFPGSPADKIVTEYMRLRKSGTDHRDAVVGIARKEGGASLLDNLVLERFNDLEIDDAGQERNITNFRKSLIDMLEAYRRDYEERIAQQELWKAGTIFSTAGGVVIRQGLEKIPGIGSLLREATSLTPIPKGLAKEGLRPGGKVIPPKKLKLPKISGAL